MPDIKPLSVTIDHSGDDPQVVINGTDYARNILGGSVTVLPYTPEPGGIKKAKVTVTFVVDDLRILSRDAGPDEVETPRACGGFIVGPVTINADPAALREGMRRAKKGGTK